MIDHIAVRVSDIDRAIAFYKAALAPLGYDVLMQYPGAVGLGQPGKPDLWIMASEKEINPTHIALSGDRATIDAFHAAAMAAGGSDNGPPGVRADYHPHYYAAFVRDPDGNNVEIVCHTASGLLVEPAPPAAKKAAPKAKAKAKAKAKPKPKAKARKPAAKSAKKPAKNRR